jgi:hypothetical protein
LLLDSNLLQTLAVVGTGLSLERVLCKLKVVISNCF